MTHARPRMTPAQQMAFDAALALIDAGTDIDLVLADVADELVADEVRSLAALRATVEDEGFMTEPAALPDPAGAFVPRRMGRYDIEGILGTGASGTVYRAVQEAPRRPVALKVLDRMLARPDARQRFAHEAVLLAALDHPGIARVLEAGTHEDASTPPGGLPFIAMELVEDASALTEYAAAHDLDIAARVALFAAACAAVGHAHARGVIHRDIKPANLLVDGHGRVKVIDLGIARIIDEDSGVATMHTAPGRVVGTLRYMSPEQADGAVETIDARSDVYALGVVLFELLCGQAPYDIGSTSISRAATIIREVPPVAPGTIHRELRGDLERITLTALAKDPRHRYADANALADDLQRFVRAQPLAFKAERKTPAVSRRQVLEIGSAAAVLFVATTLTQRCQEPDRTPLAARGRRDPGPRPGRTGPVILDPFEGDLLMFETVGPERRSLVPWRFYLGEHGRSTGRSSDRVEPGWVEPGWVEPGWVEPGWAEPLPREFAAVAVTADPPRVALFGGTTHNAVTDVLSWYDAEQSLAPQPTGASADDDDWPSKREHASLAWDTRRDRLVVFGGQFSEESRNRVARGDTLALQWTEDGPEEKWQLLEQGPSPRRSAAFVYDPQADRFVLHGGIGSDGTPRADTWILDAAHERWSLARPESEPPVHAVSARAAAWSSDHGTVLLDARGALWRFRDETWSLLAAPDPRLEPGGELVGHPTAGLLRIGITRGDLDGDSEDESAVGVFTFESGAWVAVRD